LKNNIYAIIAGSGSYIPTEIVTNNDFSGHTFHDTDGVLLVKTNETIISQFEKITGIAERRYVTDELNTSDIAYFAAKAALDSCDIDPESLDYIIVAHNFGDVSSDNYQSDMVPALASRVKALLKIHNPETVAYDLPFGCAGWLQGVIQADQLIKAGNATNILVIGAETLSRLCDPHDRDGMIFSDGAGAIILSAHESEMPVGILGHITKSYAN
jgi:3-oxoacyl-[acyl-carrier-protein] synthase-3